MPGWSAYVSENEYQQHIATYVDQTEVSEMSFLCNVKQFKKKPGQINTCDSQHDALVRASTRSSAGYAVSGVGLVICSRHCLIRKNGAGDLQLGEK